MAISKDVVKTKFTAKFGKVNAPKTYKEFLITRFYNKVKDDEDETQLDSLIEDNEDLVRESAAEFDRVRTQATKDAKKTPEQIKEEENKEVELPEDTPAYVKAIMAQLKKQDEKLAGFEQQTAQKSLEQRFTSDPRLKGIPAFALKGYVPKTEEELESNIEAITGEYAAFAQENKIAAIGDDAPDRANGDGTTTVTSKVVDEAIKNWGAAKVAELAPKETVK